MNIKFNIVPIPDEPGRPLKYVSDLRPGELFTLKGQSEFVVFMRVWPHYTYAFVLPTADYPYSKSEIDTHYTKFECAMNVAHNFQVQKVLGVLSIVREETVKKAEVKEIPQPVPAG